MSLRSRVAVLAAGAVGLALALVAVLVVGVFARQQQRALDGELQERAAAMGPLVRGGAGVDRLLGPAGFALVRGPGGGVRRTAGDVPVPPPPVTERPTTHRSPDGEWRVVSRRLGNSGAVLQVGLPTAPLRVAQERLVRLFALLGAAVLAATAAGAYALAGVATGPLARLRQAAEEVAATTDTTRRVPAAGPSEVRDLAGTLNVMLERLDAAGRQREEALAAARRFAADAGHELRTPLTSMQADLDALLRNPHADAATQRAVLHAVSAEQRRLAATLDTLQALARADAGLGGDVEDTDLAEVVDAAVDAARTRAGPATVLAEMPDEPVVVRGSAAALRAVVDNLIANALVHGRPAGRVVVRVTATPDGVRLTTDDDGPGVPPEDRSRIFDRFARGAAAAGRPGSGLGLALVAQLVRLHGGRVAVSDSPLGGARFVVQLPPAGSASAPPTATGRPDPARSAAPPAGAPPPPPPPGPVRS